MSKTHNHLDDIDINLISTMMRDGDLTLAKLGDAVQLQPKAAGDRKKRLLANQVISIRAEILEGAALWKDKRLFFFRLPESNDYFFEKFGEFANDIHEIYSVDVVAGSWDVMLRIESADGARFEAIRRSLLRAFPGSKGRTVSIVKSMRSYRVPVEALSRD